MTRVPPGGIGFTHELAVEALRRAEPVGRDLMAHRARDAVGRQAVQRRSRPARRWAGARTPRRVPPAALVMRCDIGMWQAAHSSWIAAECVGWSIVSRRTAACQYGSRAELAIIVDRQVAPIETSSPAGAQVVVARHAVLGMREEREVEVRIRRRAAAAGCASSARVARPGRATAARPRRRAAGVGRMVMESCAPISTSRSRRGRRRTSPTGRRSGTAACGPAAR